MLERNEVEYREEWNQGGGSGGGQGHPPAHRGVDLPKVLRQAAGRPLLGYVLEELSFLEKEDVVLVVGYEREKVLAAYPEYPHAVQEPQQGTGHAVQCAREALAGFDGSVLVCYGDTPSCAGPPTSPSLRPTSGRATTARCSLPCPTRSCPTAASCGKATAPSPTSWRTRTVPPRRRPSGS
ncbi:MAG: NTP transferase domain-containing protein [Flavonifractor plautii]